MGEACRAGSHCRGRTGINPAQATSRGLCLACERYGRYAIGKLPEDYTILSLNIGKGSSGFGAGIPSHRAEAPIPIRVDIDALMARMRRVLLTWERDVRYAARLSVVPPWGVRHGVEIDRATGILVEHYSVLLALQLPHSALDGIDAVMELTDLHHRYRKLIGEAALWEWRELPCPSSPFSDGCGAQSLGFWVGTNRVECVECGWSCTLDEYRSYAMTMIPPLKGLR